MRQRLLERVAEFKVPRLLTLTIDRKWFASPRDAWQAVADQRAVSKLLGALGVKWWVWALEFQMGKPPNVHREGWPHWHVLLDLGSCPGGQLDLQRAWYLWRDCWGLGGLDFRYKRTVAQSGMHGVHYITKYLTKLPKEGFPAWVMASDSVRFVQGCRALGPLVSRGSQHKHDYRTLEAAGRRRAERRSLGARVADCSGGITVFKQTLDKSTGVLGWRWACTLRGDGDILARVRADVAEGGEAHAVPGVVEVGRRTVRVASAAVVDALCDRYDLRVERGSV